MEARIVNATATAGTPVGPLLRINGVVKNFPGVKALDNVDLEVRCGEVHALLGENGAGKSTMVKIIAGEYEPDGGTLFFDGREVTMRSPAHADELGIGLIHQHFPLAPNLSAGENIFMNREPVRGMLRNIDFERLHSDARALLAQLGLDIDTAHAGGSARRCPAADGRDCQSPVAACEAHDHGRAHLRARRRGS